MTNIHEIQNFLKELLDPNNISDYALNGIQVENEKKDVEKIAFAVDASVSSIKMAIANNCSLLIVHHGFFWGKPLSITGILKKRIQLMLENDMGLIAYHLPLDCHLEYGNNIRILKEIGATSWGTFGNYNGTDIGWQTELSSSIKIEQICSRLGISLDDNANKYLDFGNKEIKKIAVVSGGGSSCFQEAIDKKVDLFITGDADHTLYHSAKESSINVLFAGHYFTEIFGIQAIQKVIEKKFKIKTFFCDIPTGL